MKPAQSINKNERTDKIDARLWYPGFVIILVQDFNQFTVKAKRPCLAESESLEQTPRICIDIVIRNVSLAD